MTEPLITIEEAHARALPGETSCACTCEDRAALEEVLAALRAEGLVSRYTVTATPDGQFFLLAYRKSDKPFEFAA